MVLRPHKDSMDRVDSGSLSAEEEGFQERIDRGEKIEPTDWMPEDYRRTLIRQISQHAHSEVVGMLPEGSWIARAPTLKRKCTLLAKVQDEAGHGQYLYSVLETLGVSRDEVYVELLAGRMKYLNIFNYPALTWADVGAIAWLTDGAAIINQVPLSRCSYGPYSRAMARVCQEESFHQRQGFEVTRILSEGTPDQKRMAQDALNRWWWPTLMMFGPPDEHSVHSAQSMKWRIKLHSNDELRQRFIDQTVPQAGALGLTIPDPQIRFNRDSGNYQTGPVDWDEFRRVINGNGPCNRDRLQAKNRAWIEGQWVREAAASHAMKKRESSQKQGAV